MQVRVLVEGAPQDQPERRQPRLQVPAPAERRQPQVDQRVDAPVGGGSSNWGWNRAWGCEASASGTETVRNQYYTVKFTCNPNGSITGTIAGQPVYADTNGDVVEQQPGFWQAFKPGDTFILTHSDTGLLTVAYSGGATGYLCNSAVSAAPPGVRQLACLSHKQRQQQRQHLPVAHRLRIGSVNLPAPLGLSMGD